MTATALGGDPISSPRLKVALLAGQAFTLGLTTAWVLIPASALFLETYGSGLLPVTYIGAAVAGAAATTMLARALRRRPLVSVAMRVLGAMTVALVTSWLLLVGLDADWVSFALLAVVPILVPVGFVFVIGQAGMLLDVRAIKALYGRVIAGFALGFVVGGVAGPLLLGVLGRTEHLLAASAVVAAVFWELVARTRRTFPRELSIVEHDEVGVVRPNLRALLSNRYVLLLMAYQGLSAIESQWLDYLVFDRADQRYQDSEDLARFISRFLGVAYGIDIIFLLVVAGFLLRRFGLRYGVTANPGVVLTLVGATIIAAAIRGSGATIVFGLIVATRASDMVLSDGATRSSVGAAYQAIPLPQRLAAQANVEGLAVPVAIGFSGLVLIVVRSTVGTDGMVLPVLTAVVVVAWAAVAIAVYREYRTNLLANLRHRTLDPAELSIDDAGTHEVIERLLDSADERDVRLGLDVLTIAHHPDLAGRLQQLALDDRVGVRSDSLDRLVAVDPAPARLIARGGLDHANPGVRAAGLRALGRVGDPSDLPLIEAGLSDADHDVMLEASVALSRLGDDRTLRDVAARIVASARSPSLTQRVLAARMLGGCEPGPWLERGLLRDLLADADRHVVNAALAALRCPDDAPLLGATIGCLRERHTAGEAVEALVRFGDLALDLVDRGLDGHLGLGRPAQELLARVCRLIGDPEAAAILRRHVDHRDREVGLAVMEALAALGGPGASEPSSAPSSSQTATSAPGPSRASVWFGPPGSDIDGATATVAGVPRSDEVAGSAVVRADLEHAAHVLHALAMLEDTPSAGTLRGALHDELMLLRRRVIAGLSMFHGAEPLNRVAFQLAQRNAHAHALALEWLDVTLVGTDRLAMAVLEPGLSVEAQLRALSRTFLVAPATHRSVVRDLIEDRDARWRRPWVTACALLVVSDTPEVGLDTLSVNGMDGTPDEEFREEIEIVHETFTGVRRRQAVNTP